ncbi:hypothetical protein WJX84_000971 [Apatococcus fuscideae]|uniref:Uncharacterized protein n=1 Tax=Apatococcus fuscideae TaxID=2026836 RepID=A0AAW1SNJ3_9CHLO
MAAKVQEPQKPRIDMPYEEMARVENRDDSSSGEIKGPLTPPLGSEPEIWHSPRASRKGRDAPFGELAGPDQDLPRADSIDACGPEPAALRVPPRPKREASLERSGSNREGIPSTPDQPSKMPHQRVPRLEGVSQLAAMREAAAGNERPICPASSGSTTTTTSDSQMLGFDESPSGLRSRTASGDSFVTDITSRSNGSTIQTGSDPSSQTSEGSWLVGGKAPYHSHDAMEIVPAPLQTNPMASLRTELQELQSKRKLDMSPEELSRYLEVKVALACSANGDASLPQMVRALQEGVRPDQLPETRSRRSYAQEDILSRQSQGSSGLPRSPTQRRSSRANPLDRLLQTCSSLSSSVETGSRHDERRRPLDASGSSRYREEHYAAPSTPSRSSHGGSRYAGASLNGQPGPSRLHSRDQERLHRSHSLSRAPPHHSSSSRHYSSSHHHAPSLRSSSHAPAYRSSSSQAAALRSSHSRERAPSAGGSPSVHSRHHRETSRGGYDKYDGGRARESSHGDYESRSRRSESLSQAGSVSSMASSSRPSQGSPHRHHYHQYPGRYRF